MKKITNERILKFKAFLIESEKSKSTLDKYIRDVTSFTRWLDGRSLNKSEVLLYKNYLLEHYSPASVNAAISSLNSFFMFNEWFELKVKSIKIQRQLFYGKDKELTKEEYERLLNAAVTHNPRLCLVMQTICACGIRVSELEFITAEAVHSGIALISCKGKMRKVYLPNQLCKALKKYMNERNITRGAVFVTKSGKPLDRSNIWSDMKKLCQIARVPESKVYPHNLRHLFARTYYSSQKDVVRLADILGHSNVNTTRIYTMESGDVHRKQIQKLGLLMC